MPLTSTHELTSRAAVAVGASSVSHLQMHDVPSMCLHAASCMRCPCRAHWQVGRLLACIWLHAPPSRLRCCACAQAAAAASAAAFSKAGGGAAPTKGVRLNFIDESPPFMTWDEIQTIIDRGGLTEEQQKDYWDCLFLDEKQVLELMEYVRQSGEHPFLYAQRVEPL